jgi:hypothetical protein
MTTFGTFTAKFARRIVVLSGQKSPDLDKMMPNSILEKKMPIPILKKRLSSSQRRSSVPPAPIDFRTRSPYSLVKC